MSTTTWPPELVRLLATRPDAETSEGLETSLEVVRARRINRKRARRGMRT